MSKPSVYKFEPIMNIAIQRYERYLPTAFDESMSILEKFNKVIEYMNEIGKLSQDIVEMWNEVAEWVMNDGLNESVIERINEMYEDGTLAQIINDEIFNMKANRTELNDIALSLSHFVVDENDPSDNIRTAFITAYDTNTPIASSKDYEVDGNIPYFNDVVKIGSGSIKRGSDVYYFTPKGNQKNTLYVSDDFRPADDGLTRDHSVSLAMAIAIIKNIGAKASNGMWSIKIIGRLTQDGVRPGELPQFKNRLIIEGERDVNGNITSIVDGDGANQAYWWRSDLHSSFKFFEFRNLQFINWGKDGVNTGALVIWENIDLYIHDCEFLDSGRGVWARSGRVQVDDSLFKNLYSGLSMQYHAHFNVNRNEFINCRSSGSHMGRLSAGHYRENLFDGCFMGIDAPQHGRLRTITNTHRNWGLTAHNIGLNTTHEVAAGQEDIIIEGSMTQDKPYQRLYYGGTSPKLTKGSHVGMHAQSFPEEIKTYREPGEYNLGAELGGRILEIPKYFLLTSGGHIQITLPVSISGLAEFDLVMTGESRPGLTDEYLRFPIVMGSAGSQGKIVLDIFTARKNSTIIYGTLEYPHQDGRKSHYTFKNLQGLRATAGYSTDTVIHRLWLVKKNTDVSVSFVGYSTQIGVIN